jgi:hypothetical protein
MPPRIMTTDQPPEPDQLRPTETSSRTDRPAPVTTTAHSIAAALPAWDLLPDQGILIRRRRTDP